MTRANLGLVSLAAIMAILPFILPNSYYFDVVNRMAINAVLALGLNLLIGFAGQISLGHAAFFGIGAYATAILTARFDWPPLAAMAAGAAAASLLAAAIAPPIFRLRGHYLAMATLGLGIIVAIAFRNEVEWTGGPDGMSVAPLKLFGRQIYGERQWYWLFAALLLFSVWSCLNLIDSPFGRALRALHGSEVAAEVAGVHVARYKGAIFVLSAFFAAVMGSLTAHYIGFVSPSVADFFHSIELVTMVVVGGVASVFGSVVGAALLTALPQALAAFEGWETVVFGAILMAFMIFLPKGLVPTIAAKFGKSQ